MEDGGLLRSDRRCVVAVKEGKVQLVVQQHVPDQLAQTGEAALHEGQVDAQVAVSLLVVLDRVVEASQLHINHTKRQYSQNTRGEVGYVKLLVHQSFQILQNHSLVKAVEDTAQMGIFAAVLRRVLVFQDLSRNCIVLQDSGVKQRRNSVNGLHIT